jgi:hypothetical protein
MFPWRQLHCNRGTVFSVRSVPRCYKQDKFGVSELVRQPLGFSCCELLLWEAGSWSWGQFREPRGRGTSAVGSRHQTKANEDCNRLRRHSVSCSYLWSVVTSCVKCSINLITSASAVYNHLIYIYIYIVFIFRTKMFHTFKGNICRWTMPWASSI